MKSWLHRHRPVFALIAVFVLTEVLVFPVGNFPLNDDWAYAKSVLFYDTFGGIHIGDWPAMTLVTHLLWGKLFTSIFGFSFFVLRLSTQVSAIIGCILLYNLVRRLGGSIGVAMLAALTLMFSPLYFNLSNTYMTDVNFTTLVILACDMTERYFSTRRIIWLVILAFLSIAAVLMRQFGLVIPLAFLLATFAIPKPRMLPILLAAAMVGLTVFSLWMYENYLRSILNTWASYKYVTQGALPDMGGPPLGTKLAERLPTSLLALLFYSFPVALAILFQPAAKKEIWIRLILLAGCGGLVWAAFSQAEVLPGNVFRNMSLGSETFYEHEGEKRFESPSTHVHSDGFGLVTEILKILFAAISLFALVWSFTRRRSSLSGIIQPFTIFVGALLLGYLILLVLSNSYFDRYHVPVIALALLGFAQLNPVARIPGVAVVGVFVFAYASIAGTHDYFAMNRARWKAVTELREKDIPLEKINAGFEPNCWNEGQFSWWTNFLTLEGYDYLVQYSSAPGFRATRSYVFQRWFPPRCDSVTVFMRESSPPRNE